MTRRAVAVGVALVALSGVAAGCGDDEPSASERVCDARTDVSTAVSDVVDEARSGNLGNARDGVEDVRSALTSVRDAAGDLAEDTRTELADEIDAVEAGITSLTEADGLEDLLDRLDAVRADVEALVSGVGDVVSCD